MQIPPRGEITVEARSPFLHASGAGVNKMDYGVSSDLCSVQALCLGGIPSCTYVLTSGGVLTSTIYPSITHCRVIITAPLFNSVVGGAIGHPTCSA